MRNISSQCSGVLSAHRKKAALAKNFAEVSTCTKTPIIALDAEKKKVVKRKRPITLSIFQ